MSTIATTQDYTSKCPKCAIADKFKHNYFLQICVDLALSCMHFVSKKGRGRCTISSRIIIIREGQIILPIKFCSYNFMLKEVRNNNDSTCVANMC